MPKSLPEPSSEPLPERPGAKGDKDAAQSNASDSKSSGSKAAASKSSRPKQSFDHLPQVASPSISPAGDDVAKEDVAKEDAVTDAPAKAEAVVAGEKPEAATIEAGEPAAQDAAQDPASAKVLAFPRIRIPAFKTSRRFKRAAANAATIAIAAGIGAIASALAIHGLAPGASKQDVALVAERQAIQTSIAVLARDVSALKSSVETAGKSSQTQAAKTATKTAARIDSAKSAIDKRNDNIVTGSVSSPAATLPDTIAAATVATITAPLPLPQPRPQIVQGWSVHLSPDGLVLVEQRGGDLYQVAPGMPLPGLGRVEAIHRGGGRIEVVTAKGVITSPARRTVRNRYDRLPPFFEPY